MKQLMILVITCLLSCYYSKAQPPKEFIVQGTIKDLPDGAMLYLVKEGGKDTLARAASRKGKFIFRGQLPGEGVFAFIFADTRVLEKPSKPMLMTSVKTIVKSGMKQWPELEVLGSTAQNDWLAFKEMEAKINASYQRRTLASVEKQDELFAARSKGDSVASKRLAEESRLLMEDQTKAAYETSMCMPDFITAHPGSYVSSYLLRMFPIEKQREKYAILHENAKNSYHGKLVKQRIETGSLEPGEKVKDFSGIAPGGEKISLYEVLAKGEYTLLDFWASWCGPCRKANPVLKELSEKYKSQGFGILSISVDENADQWKGAIEKDGMTWTHMLDEAGQVAKKYDALQLPVYVLLDKKGKVIASYFDNKLNPLTLNKLDSTIKEVLENKPSDVNGTL